ncbi:unnamed protein product [Meganyctiphanes norvegica]|uniref:Uncharacterized protein n=1 Tax=Meganyctiphanes norvegica TaxID=48144 RepID=A0AAV2QSP9_MEGNR
MRLYEPKSCCNCIGIKKGSLTVSILTLIASLLNIALACSGINAFVVGFAWDMITNDVNVSVSDYEWHEKNQNRKRNFIVYAMIFQMAWNILLGVLSCLLIHGIRKDRPRLMFPFLAWSCPRIATEVIFAIFLFGLDIYMQKPYFSFDAIVFIICTCIEIYFVLVINAYYKQVKRTLSEDHHELKAEL